MDFYRSKHFALSLIMEGELLCNCRGSTEKMCRAYSCGPAQSFASERIAREYAALRESLGTVPWRRADDELVDHMPARYKIALLQMRDGTELAGSWQEFKDGAFRWVDRTGRPIAGPANWKPLPTDLGTLLQLYRLNIVAPGDGHEYLQDAKLWTAVGRVDIPIDGPDDPEPLVLQTVGRGETPLAACEAWAAALLEELDRYRAQSSSSPDTSADH